MPRIMVESTSLAVRRSELPDTLQFLGAGYMRSLDDELDNADFDVIGDGTTPAAVLLSLDDVLAARGTDIGSLKDLLQGGIPGSGKPSARHLCALA